MWEDGGGGGGGGLGTPAKAHTGPHLVLDGRRHEDDDPLAPVLVAAVLEGELGDLDAGREVGLAVHGHAVQRRQDLAHVVRGAHQQLGALARHREDANLWKYSDFLGGGGLRHFDEFLLNEKGAGAAGYE